MNVRKIREEDKQWLFDNYESKTISECALELGISVRTLHRWANDLGLPKKRDCAIENKEFEKRQKSNNLYRIYFTVRKCCLICASYQSCPYIKCEQANPNPAKLVCWDFELNKDLAI